MPLVPASLAQRAIRRQSEEIASLDDAKKRFEFDYPTQLLRLTGGNVSQAAGLATLRTAGFYLSLVTPSLASARISVRTLTDG